VDITAITGAFQVLKNATEILQAMRQADFAIEKAELRLKVGDLAGAVSEAKIRLAEIQDLVASRDQRISELEEALAFKSKLIRDKDGYYEMNAAGSPIGAPYCCVCWESHHVAIHLYHSGNVAACGRCKLSFDRRWVDDKPR
jgi:hypothetical protein